MRLSLDTSHPLGLSFLIGLKTWEGRVGLCISQGLTRKIGTSSSMSTEGIECRTVTQVMEELKQIGYEKVAPRLAPVGCFFFLEAGGRRGGGGVIPAQGPGPLCGSWNVGASGARAGAMEGMLLEAENEGGNTLASSPHKSWVSASYCPQASRQPDDVEPAGVGREG